MKVHVLFVNINVNIWLLSKTDEFRRKHIAVMVISFGVEKGAKIWLDETKCTFPMLLDQERTLYASFGLQRSIEKV